MEFCERSENETVFNIKDNKLTQPALYLEFKPTLQCVYCIIRTGKFSHVDVQKSAIELGTGEDKLIWNFSSLGHLLRVDTCNGLNKKTESEIHFRLQTSSKLCDADVCDGDLQVPSPSYKSAEKGPFCDDNCLLSCGSCQQVIVDTGCFQRMLPLPSSGWSDMVDNLFCCQHKHDCDMGRLSTDSLVPRQDDVLYNDFTLLTHYSKLQGVRRKPGQNALICSRCKYHVGEMHINSGEENGVSVLYLHSLSFSRYGENLTQPLLNLETAFSHHLLEQCERSLSFKFLIEYKLDGKTQQLALVWLLERDLQMVHGSSDGNVESFSAIKVLYLPAFKASKEIISSWIKDNRVTNLVLPQSAAVYILDLLRHSTNKLPVSLMKASEMFVGFLKAE